MIKSIFKKINLHHLMIVSIIFCSLYLSYVNHVPNTYLTGWDTLHPEFNYKIYLTRIFSGIWQEHQGLGSAASQAHASELPRMIPYLVLDLIFGQQLVRYAYLSLMLVLGPLGVYLFLFYILKKRIGENLSSLAAFSGGLYYLFNYATLQQFVVPLEMFTTHYGFLGFVFLYATKYLETSKRKDLVMFLLSSFFIIPQAHTPTLFYVYFMFLFTYLFFMFANPFVAKETRNIHFKNSILLIALTLFLNFFWLGGNIYYALMHGHEVGESKIHHLFSDEAFLVNKQYGNIRDVSILKNFLFSWGYTDSSFNNQMILDAWVIFQKRDTSLMLGYLFFGFISAGFLVSLFKKDKYAVPIGAIFFASLFFIFNENPPLGFFFRFLQDYVPLFREVFRFPFTKFSIMTSFSYSLLFGMFFGYFWSHLESIFKSRRTLTKIIIVMFALLTYSQFYFYRPAFKGNFVQRFVQVSIPDRYFEMFEYFDSQEEYGRVAGFPIHSFWGWAYYDWSKPETMGYQGAGFLWFGIKQPLIDREFDRWNILNEQPYRELSQSLYSEDVDAFERVLEKFKIRWLLLDESVTNMSRDHTSLWHEQTKKLFDSSPNISLEADFGEGLYVYRYMPKSNFTRSETLNRYAITGNTVFKEYTDPIYEEYGNYIRKGNSQYIFLGKNTVDETLPSGHIESEENSLSFLTNYTDSLFLNQSSESIPTYVYLVGEGSDKTLELRNSFGILYSSDVEIINYPLILSIGNNIFSVTENTSFVGKSIVLDDGFLNYGLHYEGEKIIFNTNNYSVLEACSPSSGDASYSVERKDNGFTINARNVLGCVTIPLSKILEFVPRDLIKISFDTTSDVDHSDFCLLNNKSGLCEDYYLPGEGFYAFLKGDVSDYDLRFYLDARNRTFIVERSYTDFSLTFYNSTQKDFKELDVEKTLQAEDLVFSKDANMTTLPSQYVGNRGMCNGKPTDVNNYFENIGPAVKYVSKTSHICDNYSFPTASHNTGYVLEILGRHVQGMPLRFCLTNEYSKRCDIEVSIPKDTELGRYFYVVPPMGNGTGYTLNIANLSYGKSVTENEIHYVSLVPISYDLIKSVKTEPVTVADGNLLVLNEAYEKGWLAFCGILPCKAEHVVVNNWSNGWVFSNPIPKNVRFIFWPQILQYIGFVILGLMIYPYIFATFLKIKGRKVR